MKYIMTQCYISIYYINDNLSKAYCVRSKIHCVLTAVPQGILLFSFSELFSFSALYACTHMRCLLANVHVTLFVDRNILCACLWNAARSLFHAPITCCVTCRLVQKVNGNDIFAENFQTFINLVCLFVTRPWHHRGKRIANNCANFYGDVWSDNLRISNRWSTFL